MFMIFLLNILMTVSTSLQKPLKLVSTRLKRVRRRASQHLGTNVLKAAETMVTSLKQKETLEVTPEIIEEVAIAKGKNRTRKGSGAIATVKGKQGKMLVLLLLT